MHIQTLDFKQQTALRLIREESSGDEHERHGAGKEAVDYWVAW